ncbi:MAG: amylo-alpha-1,6-glucosidase [Jatrophihabitans sp.]|uniref:amylo-alpha-1,6-glucosidase n=1 Tax=Jatrophihabitans sp. TaxID=1932789 RepID=UPI003F7EC7D0
MSVFGDNRAERPGAEQVTLVEGSSFCVGDRTGDLGRSRAQGLFVRDLRLLSRWELTVDGAALLPLSVQCDVPFAATFLAQPAHAPDGGPLPLVVRRRYVGDGMREDIVIRNDTHRTVTCRLELAVGVDRADLFAVKSGAMDHAADTVRVTDPAELRSVGDDPATSVTVRSTTPGATADGFAWNVVVPPRGRWSTALTVELVLAGRPLGLQHAPGQALEYSVPSRELDAWRAAMPRLHTPDRRLAALLRRSVEDIGALRMRDPEHPDRVVVAAGAPWFMALFGRDALLTAWMALPVDARLALGTLQTLAERQGRADDPVTEEQPGRILHEARLGRGATVFGGAGAYYGSVDATALFVLLAGEVRRWRGPEGATDELLPAVDRALGWLRSHTDRGDGFVTYARSSPHGLVNQGWKDSWDGISFADGTLAEPPIALAEVQGYTYAAYRARARWAEQDGEVALAAAWDDRATRLRDAFDARFWLPEHRRYAVALDGAGRAVDALASNIGHCLWCGIVPDEHAAPTAAALVSPDLFSGWGVRTLATSMGAYDPLSYHNGSVWPHDTALAVAGLMRYGFVDEARRIASGLLDAATRLTRLPELFAGFARSTFHEPVPVPAACSPQAWASAAPLLLLRSLLELEPDGPDGPTARATAVPTEWLPLSLRGVPLRGHWLDVTVDADRAVVVLPTGRPA